MRERLSLLGKRIGESTTSCALTMVKGNVAALSLGHWQVALQTGILAGLATILFVSIDKTHLADNKFAMAGLLGLFTAIVDGVIHPAHFSQESIVTGIGAGLLCLVMTKATEKKKV